MATALAGISFGGRLMTPTKLFRLLALLAVMLLTSTRFRVSRNLTKDVDHTFENSESFLTQDSSLYPNSDRSLRQDETATSYDSSGISGGPDGVRGTSRIDEISKIPNDGNSSKKEKHTPQFSACILIKDENHRLPEWIAYHYFALNLRRIIFVYDPLSIETPLPVFDLWRNLTDLEVIEWKDAEYGLVGKLATGSPLFQHRKRQNHFLKMCGYHLKNKLNATWVAYHDVDEYLAVNGAVVENSTAIVSQPNHLASILHEMEQKRNGTDSRCFKFARRTFPPKESAVHEVEAGAPSWLNASRFDTFNWRYYSRDKRLMPGKVALNLATIHKREMRRVDSPHTVYRSICKNPYLGYDKELGYHHYTGSLQSYTRMTKDSRGDREARWREKTVGNKIIGSTDEIKPWLQGFIDLMGEEKSRTLLMDVGDTSVKYWIENITSIQQTQ